MEHPAEPEPLPGYLRQTFTSSSPHSSHYCNERIRNSFSPASCWSVKAIPAAITAQSMHDARVAHLIDVRTSKGQKRDTGLPRFFTPLRYGHSDYGADKVNSKRDADIRELNLISFSRKPFRLSSSKVKMQHEDIIDNENFVYPTLGPSDETLMYRGRGAAVDKAKPSYGLFRPGGRATKEQQVKEEGRRLVPDWSRQMFAQLSEDWPQLRFRLRFTTDDEFVFSFDAPSDGDEGGPSKSATAVMGALNRYMKHFSTHGLASEFRLIKRGDRWNCLEPAAASSALSPLVGSSRPAGTSSAGPISPEKRLRFEDAVESDADENVEQPSSQDCVAHRAARGPGSVLVYSFFAPWVTVAGAKTRRMESLRSRVMARTGSLNLMSTLAPLGDTATSSSARGGRRDLEGGV